MTTDAKVQRLVRLRSVTTREWYASPELRPRLVADANEQGTNLTEIVLMILAKRLGYTYAPNGRRTEPGASEEIVKLDVPLELDRLVGAAYPDVSRPKAIIRLLSAHYGLGIPVPKQRARRRRRSAASA